MALKIFNKFATNSDIIFVSHEFEMGESFLPIYRVNIKTISFPFYVKPTMYLINFTNYDIRMEMELYSNDITWNPRAKFIFLNYFQLDLLEFQEYIKEYFIRNFVLIFNSTFYQWNLLDLTEPYENSSSK